MGRLYWSAIWHASYGTHVWQVADSSEMNGAFKLGVTKAKKEYFAIKPSSCQNWSTTDVIPITNHAFPGSFGRVDKAKKVISDRGWGPLNYNLLWHSEILKTKPATPVTTDENELSMSCLPPLLATAPNTNTGTGSTLTINVTKGAVKKENCEERADERRGH